jgi:hypothetical protein
MLKMAVVKMALLFLKITAAVPKDGAVVKIVRHQCVAERCLF